MTDFPRPSDFRRMNYGGISVPRSLPQPDQDYLRSPQFAADLARLDDNPEALADLTIRLLGEIALEPRIPRGLGRDRGCGLPQLKDYLPGYDPKKPEESVFVCCSLYGWGNPVGYFTLPVASPAFSRLKAAIEANLASDLFKAAVRRERVRRLENRKFDRINALGSVAYNDVYHREVQEHIALVGGRRNIDSLRIKQIAEQASQAGETLTAPLRARLSARLKALTDGAYRPMFRGSYTEALARFALTHIRTA